MASIFGFKLKNRKTFQGREGEGNQGNLWYENKRVAWYSDCGNGGSADIDFYNGVKGIEEFKPILDEAVKKYYERYPMTGDYAHLTPNAELFMSELLTLMDREKSYKSMLKKGYPVVIMYKEAEDSPYEHIIGLKSASKVERFIEKEKITKYNLYTSVEDFDIK